VFVHNCQLIFSRTAACRSGHLAVHLLVR